MTSGQQPLTPSVEKIIMDLQQRMQKMEVEKVQTEQAAKQAIAQAEEDRANLARQSAQMNKQYQEAARTLQDEYNQSVNEVDKRSQTLWWTKVKIRRVPTMSRPRPLQGEAPFGIVVWAMFLSPRS